ncbi:MAG TPA: thioredoxin domain-containing protein [Acidimicrobiia bacterium]|jgi:uncharacterized protein YyaL (SSP411 family)|nr:thioredoxin domain-containing protein [Acidimicrobiia bacterium]
MTNRLGEETSPYLHQHRDNPVDWYPWGEEAFERARSDGKAIFLSVGYSSCHWCHVMAHESFEDPATAELMNRLFVNVKVDREERPDVDAVYMQAVQALTGRGGWPMSVWLTPDGRPFYGGTYYPNEDRHGMPSFTKVCEVVAQAWDEQRDDVEEQANKLTEAIDESVLRARATSGLDAAMLSGAVANVRAQFDPSWGGFGRAPKFPQAMTLDFLCRQLVLDPAPETREMITTTLDAMAAGGIHDHLGGGFARYSTDEAWLVPHFEKMLYDNALLTRAYLHGYLVTGEVRYRAVVEDTIGYVLRDLTDPAGGFYAAEDADSEGIEGKFYLWSLDEIRQVCGLDADDVIRYYGVSANGNFVDPHTHYSGNILHAVDRTEPPPESVQRARAALFARRELRTRPGLDNKVLLGWNALFLTALTEAAAALDRDDWMAAARANATFLLRELRREDGRFRRSWRAPYLAYAEDYAALLEALLTLSELDDVTWLADARGVADDLVRLFQDPEGGGFFTTGHDAEVLVVRPKDLFDDATPSANSLAANGLLRLAALTGEQRYEEPAIAILEMLAGPMTSHPTGFAYLLGALERHVRAPIEVVIVGDGDDPHTLALRREVNGRLIPASVTVTAAAADPDVPLLADRPPGDAPMAYVCEHYACRRPVTSPTDLRSQLDAALAARAQPGAV